MLEIPSLSPFGKPYQIVFEKENNALPESELFSDLYDKIQENAALHLPALLALHQRHPGVPEVANLLTFAYLKLKKKKEAEALIEKTYRQHPNYLIARINYADQALRRGKAALVPQIFGGCFELSQLYPERETFHYAEFRGFMTLMGFYHLEIGQRDKAEERYQLAFQVDPLHPSVSALERAIFKKSLKKMLLSLARIFKKG